MSSVSSDAGLSSVGGGVSSTCCSSMAFCNARRLFANATVPAGFARFILTAFLALLNMRWERAFSKFLRIFWRDDSLSSILLISLRRL